MFTKPDEAYRFVNLRPTMLDDAGWFLPFIDIWTREKLPWAETPAIHKFDTLPKPEEWALLSRSYIAQAGW